MIYTGMIFIKRGHGDRAKQSLVRAAKLVAKEKSVLVFPEGTRSDGKAVSQFKKGAFMLSLDSNTRIVPIAITGTSTLWAKNALDSKGTAVKVRIGKSISPSDYSHETVRQFMNDTHKAVVDLKCV